MLNPLNKDISSLLNLLLKCLYFIEKLLILQHVIGDSFAIFLNLEWIYVSMRTIDFLDEALILQLLVVYIHLILNLLSGSGVRDILYHYAKISSSDSVVVHHPLVFNLVEVYEKKADHPYHYHSDQQPTLYRYHPH